MRNPGISEVSEREEEMRYAVTKGQICWKVLDTSLRTRVRVKARRVRGMYIFRIGLSSLIFRDLYLYRGSAFKALANVSCILVVEPR